MAHPADRGFAARHIGSRAAERDRMLEVVGVRTLEDLVGRAAPSGIRVDAEPTLPPASEEAAALARLRAAADRNEVVTSYLGLGFHNTVTPPVLRRNLLENPAWYTAYTPYQPEISQGRLEALLAFQTMVSDLTGLEIANASLLDESSAAAEAMALLRRVSDAPGDVFVVAPDCHPHTIEVVRVRAEPLGVEVRVEDPRSRDPDEDVYGVLLQQPGTLGQVHDDRETIGRLHERGVLVAVVADLLALTLITPPGEQGADVAVGTTQRFGVPLLFGGPHAGYLATRERYTRSLPGRLVGVSRDAAGRPAYRLALQTREQHIRRERATSNICTAQTLLAVLAAMYAAYHGPEGLTAIAERVHAHARRLAAAARAAGHRLETDRFFDTVTVVTAGAAGQVVADALASGYNLRAVDADRVVVALDETTTDRDIAAVARVLGYDGDLDDLRGVGDTAGDEVDGTPAWSTIRRTSGFLEHPIFHRHRTETEMLRYLRRLADRDYALDRGMIPLGSCTMKLNAAAELEPVTWPGFAELHPFAPLDQAAGTVDVIRDLEAWLAEITGYDAVSLQPNAGSQGEFAGLLAIRAYHRDRGEPDRDVCLIPSSAHGTNAASAVMAGMQVVVAPCDDDGDVDVDHVKRLAAEHADRLAALMVTYPSTHGVFEERIRELCDVIHEYGGQVYLDGANLNALIGVGRPGRFGADVSHLNLHKTFCIPHGGGGPGVGPVGVRAHLAPYLPNHPLRPEAGPRTGVGPLTAAPWGSAGILPISWMYIAMMGAEGLTAATHAAILHANYVAARLRDHYPVLYTGDDGLVAHECIIDLRPLERATGVDAEDVAKRLIDYGFHAPTMSFPVAGTLMIEPTESEPPHELDRFCDAMIAIREEIGRVESGEWPRDDNPLVHAPHVAEDVLTDQWSRPYPRRLGAMPAASPERDKYWPPVARIDQAYGDRNLICSCPPIDAYLQD